MVRFAARTCPIMDPCEQIKRGEAVTNGLRRLLLKGIKMDGVVCATVILRKDFLTWNSFGVCKESTFVSSISELPNLPFHSYDVRNRLSVAYAVACACSDMITSKMKKYKCKGKGERIEVSHRGTQSGPVQTKDEDILQLYLLDSIHKGNFSFSIPWQSSRLNLMLPNSLVKDKEGPSTSLNDSMRQLMQLVRERGLDLVKTRYAQKVGVIIAFHQDSDLSICWRLCSLGRDGEDFLFGSLCGEYIDAINTMQMKNPRIYRLLPVRQALKGNIASVQEDAIATSSSNIISECETSLSSGFMKPLSEISTNNHTAANEGTTKGAIAVLTSVLKKALLKLATNVRLIQEWSNFRRQRTNVTMPDTVGNIEMQTISTASNGITSNASEIQRNGVDHETKIARVAISGTTALSTEMQRNEIKSHETSFPVVATTTNKKRKQKAHDTEQTNTIQTEILAVSKISSSGRLIKGKSYLGESD